MEGERERNRERDADSRRTRSPGGGMMGEEGLEPSGGLAAWGF